MRAMAHLAHTFTTRAGKTVQPATVIDTAPAASHPVQQEDANDKAAVLRISNRTGAYEAATHR